MTTACEVQGCPEPARHSVTDRSRGRATKVLVCVAHAYQLAEPADFCGVPECTKFAVTRGWCNLHRQAGRAPLRTARPPLPQPERAGMHDRIVDLLRRSASLSATAIANRLGAEDDIREVTQVVEQLVAWREVEVVVGALPKRYRLIRTATTTATAPSSTNRTIDARPPAEQITRTATTATTPTVTATPVAAPVITSGAAPEAAGRDGDGSPADQVATDTAIERGVASTAADRGAAPTATATVTVTAVARIQEIASETIPDFDPEAFMRELRGPDEDRDHDTTDEERLLADHLGDTAPRSALDPEIANDHDFDNATDEDLLGKQAAQAAAGAREAQEKPMQTDTEDQAAQILSAIELQPGADAAAIHELTGIPRQKIGMLVGQLSRKGLAHRREDGWHAGARPEGMAPPPPRTTKAAPASSSATGVLEAFRKLREAKVADDVALGALEPLLGPGDVDVLLARIRTAPLRQLLVWAVQVQA